MDSDTAGTLVAWLAVQPSYYAAASQSNNFFEVQDANANRLLTVSATATLINPDLVAGAKLGIKHTTRSARAMVTDLHYRLDINSLHRDESATSLGLNEIGRVGLRVTQPLFVDEYRRNRETGSFILIDEATNSTVGAGMVLGGS